MIRSVLFPDVFVVVKVIFGKFDFLLMSIFLAESTSLATRTGVAVCLVCSCCGVFVLQGILSFPLWEVFYAIWGPKGFLLYLMGPASFPLIRFVLLSMMIEAPLG